ncbi:integrase family protein, partial [Pseudomonas syringae pv. actinidiae ICMP 18886]
MALTDTALRTAKPRDKLYRLADAQGLCIEVTPSGGKLWRLRYRFDGKAKMLSLGIYPAITLAQARERREAARRMLAQGVDPSAHKQQEKTAAAAQVLTMELLAREWYDYNRPRWAPATSSKVLQYLESDIFPVIGRQPASEVQRPELVELVRKIEKREAFNVARKVRQWLSQIFRFGLAKGVVPGNPATDLDVVA